ncbi:MAG: DUF4389 domain-containing protein [Gammaproteobacteria bacterium]|nr:MAG: DUF4389 domain-containing protein [Gammaproteobacteria bacterium]
MNEETKANLLNTGTWIRLLYMILFALLLVLARLVILAVAVLQFIFVLVTAKPNLPLLELGQGVAKWALQAFLFLTYNSDEKPYPFTDWPETQIVAPEPVKAAEESKPSATKINNSEDVPSFVAPAEDENNTPEGNPKA